MRFDLQARHQQVDKLLENKLSFDSDDAQLSIYDTYESAFNVPLSSSNVLFSGMLQGKKVDFTFDLQVSIEPLFFVPQEKSQCGVFLYCPMLLLQEIQYTYRNS